ncbi:MAG: sulfite exporter TauE/SafE family protein [Burkholderiales bacterium]
MPFDTDVLIAAPLIIVGAYTIFGISGFGSSLISIPLLAHFLPLKTVVPMMVLLDFSASFMTGLQSRPAIVWSEVRPLVPWMLGGIALGVWLLSRVPGDALILALGVFVTSYGVLTIVRHVRQITASKRWAAPAGFAGGVMGAMFGAGGPIYVAYVSARLHDPDRFRATMSVVFSLGTSVRIVLFLITGLLLDARLWFAGIALFPVMLLGTAIGRRIHVRLSRGHIARVIGGLLVVSGVSLIARSIASH